LQYKRFPLEVYLYLSQYLIYDFDVEIGGLVNRHYSTQATPAAGYFAHLLLSAADHIIKSSPTALMIIKGY
jgi:hypothetical protein